MLGTVKLLSGAFLAGAITLAASQATAATITYTDSGIGSGSIGGTAFSNALITLTGVGDTGAVVPFGSQFSNNVFPLTIDIAGIGTATYNGGSPAFAFTNHTPGTIGGGFGGSSAFVFGTFSANFASYDLSTAFGPESGPGVFQNLLLTTLGDLVLTSLGETTFTATIEPDATPLPGALPLFASGFGALGLLGWHRKRKATTAAA
jgi:hypothetical protein